MADTSIVSCPGCGKRYSVPPGVPPGQFQCQDCSAVVVYGQAGQREQPAGGPARGKGSARSHAKAAAARKRTQRERARHEDGDEEDDRPGRHGHGGAERKSAMPYVLGFVTLAILAGISAYAMNKSSEPPKSPTVAAGPKGALPPAGGLGIPGAAPLPPEPTAPAEPPPTTTAAPPPAPAPRATPGIQTAVRSAGVEQKGGDYKEVANPPSGGNYGKTQNQLLVMLKDSRASVLTELGHLPDTPPELQARIDEAMAKIVDVNSGTAAIRAKDALIKIGRPAIPRVLSAFAKLDFSRYGDVMGARDECVVADYADEILREITAYPRVVRLQFSPEAKLTNYQAAGEDWYVWWLTLGYKRETFYKKEADTAEDRL